jgi:hypothetical protein
VCLCVHSLTYELFSVQLRAEGLLGEAKLQQRRQSSEDGGVVEVQGGTDTGAYMLFNTITATLLHPNRYSLTP